MATADSVLMQHRNVLGTRDHVLALVIYLYKRWNLVGSAQMIFSAHVRYVWWSGYMYLSERMWEVGLTVTGYLDLCLLWQIAMAHKQQSHRVVALLLST